MKNKGIVAFFVVVVMLLSTLGIKKGSDAKFTADKAIKRTEVERIDSIINYRFMSYDSRFMFANSVVVNSEGKIIGTLILHTNQKYLDSFYNSNPEWKKTRLYKNIKTGKIQILLKE